MKNNLPTSGYVIADGLSIHFECFGNGSPMMLVHGWGSDTKNNWVDTGWVHTLKDHRCLISIDVRGHGKSDKPYSQAPYSYAAMSHDVIAVMDALHIDHADYIGYSMGSFMGAYLLGHEPDRFSSMILGGIGEETPQSAAQGVAIAEALRAADSSAISNPLGKSIRSFVEANPSNDLESLAFSALQMWPEGYPLEVAGPNITDAKFPVLVVNGERDHPYVDSADQFVNALPNGKHLRIPGTDHLTTVTDDRFKKSAIKFLASLKGQP